MVFHWSLSNSKSPQAFRILLSILAVLKIAVVWMVSTRPLISKSSSLFNNPLVSVPKTPITVGIFVTFMFHNFFSSLPKSWYLSFFFFFFFFLLSFSFTQWSAGTAKSTILPVLFFCCWCCLLLFLVFCPRLGDPFIIQNPRGLLLLLLLFTPWAFLTSVLADGLSLGFEWQQVSSSLQNSSQYSGRSQQCCSLDGIHSSSYFQAHQSL